MKFFLLAFFIFFTLFAGQSLAQPIADTEKPVVDAATAWLGLIDAGDFATSWQRASTFFRRAVTQEKWTEALTGLRTPLGPATARNAVSAGRFTSLPGVPDGHYVVMTFTTAFANKQAATETVTFMQDPDGSWRAAGYFIK